MTDFDSDELREALKVTRRAAAKRAREAAREAAAQAAQAEAVVPEPAPAPAPAPLVPPPAPSLEDVVGREKRAARELRHDPPPAEAGPSAPPPVDAGQPVPPPVAPEPVAPEPVVRSPVALPPIAWPVPPPIPPPRIPKGEPAPERPTRGPMPDSERCVATAEFAMELRRCVRKRNHPDWHLTRRRGEDPLYWCDHSRRGECCTDCRERLRTREKWAAILKQAGDQQTG